MWNQHFEKCRRRGALDPLTLHSRGLGFHLTPPFWKTLNVRYKVCKENFTLSHFNILSYKELSTVLTTVEACLSSWPLCEGGHKIKKWVMCQIMDVNDPWELKQPKSKKHYFQKTQKTVFRLRKKVYYPEKFMN